MDEQRRRADAIDHELSRAFRAQTGTAAPGPHLDAEGAAAWFERRLDPAVSGAYEAHLAACPDCQTLIATLARITPEPEPSAGWWPALRRPWFVPAAAAAAVALVIWIVLPQRTSTPQLESTQARAEAPVEPAAPAAPEARQFLEAEPKTTAPPETLNTQEATSAPRGNAAPAPPLARERRDAAKVSATLPPPPPPSSAPALGAAESSADVRVTASAPVVDVQTARKATVAGETPASASPAAAPPAERQEQAAADALPRTLNESVTLSAARGAGTLNVVAADGRGRWRRSGAIVEFAPSPTAPFAAAVLPISAAALTAGSSPGGSVGWFVGAAGAVLVTTDGVRFVRVTAPAVVDLVSVAATDARSAIVTAAGGRRFRTTDQGATWTAVP